MNLVSPTFVNTVIVWSKAFVVLKHPTTKSTVSDQKLLGSEDFYLTHLYNLHRTKGNVLIIVS